MTSSRSSRRHGGKRRISSALLSTFTKMSEDGEGSCSTTKSRKRSRSGSGENNGSEKSEPAEPGEVLSVTCGQVVAKLHMNRFICPGIHQECIEVEDGVFVTPKVFAVMGEKEKLKDWKNAIRINGKSIRKRMDAGELEFSRHDEICTGRCASRNLGGSKYDAKIESLKAGAGDSYNAPKSRKKNHHIISNSQPSDLASLRTLLSSPALSEPGYSALREAQGEASPATSVHTPPMYSNQPVFPSAIMVPADQEVKAEPTSECDIGADISNHNSEDVNSTQDPVMENSFSPGHEVDAEAAVPPARSTRECTPMSEDEERELKVAEAEPTVISRPQFGITRTLLGSPHMNGGTMFPIPRAGDLQEEGLGGLELGLGSGQVPVPVNNVVELNRDVMEAIKFASDLPDSDSLLEDSVSFWQSIVDLGLLDSFFREIKRELDSLKHDFHCTNRANSKNAQQLSNIVSELGLMTKLKWRLAQAKSQTEREKEDLHNHIELLKRHVAESELKQKELKRKSECFESLMEIGRSKRAATSTPNSCMSATSSSADDRPT